MFGAWLRSGVGSKRVTSSYPQHRAIDQATWSQWNVVPLIKGPCTEDGCAVCVGVCPSSAIAKVNSHFVIVDTGACISCALCITSCPIDLFVWNRNVVFASVRADLVCEGVKTDAT